MVSKDTKLLIPWETKKIERSFFILKGVKMYIVLFSPT
jgi:hypothetical protein